jgi:large subunit ribosomal protein L35
MKNKLKTRKSALKRILFKENFFKRKKAYKGHLIRKKNSKRLRRLSENVQVNRADIPTIRLMLPYR